MLPESVLHTTPSADPPPATSGLARSIRWLAVCSDLGAPLRGARDGPGRLLQALAYPGAARATMLEPHGEDRAALSSLIGDIARAIDETPPDALPFVLSGDHSSAIGTWQGICRRTRRNIAKGVPPGLVWIDAHMDAHTPQTTPSGAVHGMPLAVLLGEGDPGLVDRAAQLDPSRVVLVGVRSFETAEAQRLGRLGVRVQTMTDIRRDGLVAVLASAIRQASAGGGAWGLSLDLDALDPADAPAVNTPAPGGIKADELIGAFKHIDWPEALAGLELTEYNPARDTDGRTGQVALALLRCLLEIPAQGHTPR